jgi:lipopolysaccharide transport system ATP-binding protein
VMRDTVVKVENLCKQYRLGTISHGTLYRDLQSWSARILGKDDPNTKITSAGVKRQDGCFSALHDVSFEVKRGDVLGIIGRNGAGKSTLLKIISKVTAPTKGQVKIKGRVASLLEVGTGFHPELTGRENVFLNGAILGMTKKEIFRKLDEIVGFAEVEQFIDTPVKRYSSGMYVRLAFAVAAHLEPEVLVVDEVLAVGDIQFQEKCLGKMNEVSRSGRTILFVSHNMEAVSTLCSRAIVLRDGRIAYGGDVQSAIDAYRETVRSAGISVDNCLNRGGSGGVRITNVWTSSASQECGAMILAGEPMYIHIELEVQPQYRGKNISVGIAVDTANGKRLFTNVSSWEGDKVIVDGESAVVRCFVGGVVLVPGTYLVSTSVLFQTDTLDCAVHCAEFDVHTNNAEFYVPREKDQGDIYIPCAFDVLDNTPSRRTP